MSPKYVALIFIREFVMFSALSCLPAGPSLSPLCSPGPAQVPVRQPWGQRERASPSRPHLHRRSGSKRPRGACCRVCAASPSSPNWVLRLGVSGGCSADVEGGQGLGRGGRTESGRALPARPWRGKDPCDVHLVPRLRSERAGALSPRSPRPPVGGALVMHYSSPSRPPARAAAASLAFPARAPGCAEERERGAFTILWQLRE